MVAPAFFLNLSGRLLENKRVYLPLGNVADTPFNIQGGRGKKNVISIKGNLQLTKLRGNGQQGR